MKIGPNQFPDVYRIAERGARRLGMPLPDLFVVQDPTINAFTMGFFGRKSIVLHSATIQSMDEDELGYVIGHELTHIKCAHTHWMALTNASGAIGLPLVSVLVRSCFKHPLP